MTDPSPMRVTVHQQIAPGWTVRVDGEAADIADADGFFLGVDVPSGTRTVVFSIRTAMAQTVARADGCWTSGDSRARRGRSAPTLEPQAGAVKCRWAAE